MGIINNGATRQRLSLTGGYAVSEVTEDALLPRPRGAESSSRSAASKEAGGGPGGGGARAWGRAGSRRPRGRAGSSAPTLRPDEIGATRAALLGPRSRRAPGRALPQLGGSGGSSGWRVEKRPGARPASRCGTRGAGQGWLGGASRVPGGAGRSRRSVVGRSVGLCFDCEGVYGPGFPAQNSAKAKATTIICLLLEVLE